MLRLLLVLVLLAPDEQSGPPVLQGAQEPIKDWTYQRRQADPKTGREEITAIIKGDEAIPVDLTRDKEVFEVKGVEATYWTDPRPPRTEKTEKISVRADHARMDNAKRTLELKDRVVVRRENGAVLTAPAAVLRFLPVHACVECGQRHETKGVCPRCALPLKEQTEIAIEAPRDFEYRGPDGALRGVGLRADDTLTDVLVERDGFIEILGDPRRLRDGGPPDPALDRPFVTQFASAGPLTIRATDGDLDLRRIVGTDGVRIDRLDDQGTITVVARRMEVSARRGPAAGAGGFEVDGVVAEEDVRLSGVQFADARAIDASGDRMVMARRGQGLRAEVTGEPASARIGGDAVRAPRIVYESGNPGSGRRTVFEGGVEASIARFREGASPLRLRCRTLETTTSPGRKEPDVLDARGAVEIEGLPGAEGRPAGRAEAERFVWHAVEGRGRLEAPRAARIEQDGNVITAPQIFLSDGGASALLCGPKQVRFVQERDGVREEVRISSEGHLLYDASSGRVRLEDRCSVRTPDFRFFADRIDAVLAPGGRGLQSLVASGRVHGGRPSDGLSLRGDRLVFDPVRRELRLSGRPYAVASSGGARLLQDTLVFSEKPAGADGGKTRIMEMRGGGRGVTIIIPQAPE